MTYQNHTHEHTVSSELICHLPYAVFSVAFALVILSVLSALSLDDPNQIFVKKGAQLLFHSFHYMHIVFAATGTIISFGRFSKSIPKALIIGTLSPTFFCMLSDVILPYLGGRMMGITMNLHICFWSDISQVLPFLLVGIVNGLIMSRHHESKLGAYAASSHAIHIFVSSLASTFYLISHGFIGWYMNIGSVFLFLIGAVVLPCTLSDVVVPISFAKRYGEKG